MENPDHITSDLPVRTIPDLLARAVSIWPDRDYLLTRDGQVMSSMTFRDVARTVSEIAAGLKEIGYEPHDCIALLSENRSEWVLCYLAVLSAGCIVVPIDSLMPPAEMCNIIRESGSRMVLCSSRMAARLSDAPGDGPPRVELRLIDRTEDGDLRGLPRGTSEVSPGIRPTDTAAIIFTSGTTGHAKGVMLSHGNLLSNVESCRQACEVVREDNFLLLLPLHHMFSCTVNLLLSLASGARATFATSYKSRDIVDDIRCSGVTVLVGVPQVFENMMNGIRRKVATSGLVKRGLVRTLLTAAGASNRIGIDLGKPLFRSLRQKAGLDSVRLMVSGGAALHPDVNQFFQRLGFDLIQGYGLTETSPVLSVNQPLRNRIGSVGPAVPGVELRIDASEGSTVGEICARGANIMQGYYGNPEETDRVMRNGWFHTGDAGYLDDDGFLFVTGRIKNVVVTAAGKNVYPEEIEACLNLDSCIEESLVMGVERQKGSGEELCALLKVNGEYLESLEQKGKTVEAASLVADVVRRYNKSVPPYRRIREWRLQVDDFEKTSIRKIKRYLYRDVFVRD